MLDDQRCLDHRPPVPRDPLKPEAHGPRMLELSVKCTYLHKLKAASVHVSRMNRVLTWHPSLTDRNVKSPEWGLGSAMLAVLTLRPTVRRWLGRIAVPLPPRADECRFGCRAFHEISSSCATDVFAGDGKVLIVHPSTVIKFTNPNTHLQCNATYDVLW